MEFASSEDREYFMTLDPAHTAYSEYLTTGEFPIGGANMTSFTAGDY